jgi:hypothetical protein
MAPDLPEDAMVLCDTGREVLVTWDARDGVVALKAFSMGPQTIVALDASYWGADESGLAEDSRARLTRALDRLVAQLA